MTIEQLAETCREYRKKANLSQGDLADLADYEQCSISQFEREIKTWPWKKELVFPCTYDGIQKPLSSGKLTRTIDKWEEDGASKQMINLGEALLNYLK